MRQFIQPGDIINGGEYDHPSIDGQGDAIESHAVESTLEALM